MFSVDYIHKSQDAQSWNLVNFKNCKGYSVSPCVSLQWVYQTLSFGFCMGFMLF